MGLGTSYFTTPRLWQMEQKVMESVGQEDDAGGAVVEPAVLARHSFLSDEQAEMVRRITTGGERIVTVAARPGTGKTTALKAAREAWSEAGVRGIGVATARSASGELAHAGVPSQWITALPIARRVRDVAELNARARALLLAEGRLGGPSVTVGGVQFAVGDRVVTRANVREVSNRERWEVIGSTPTRAT